MAGLLNYCGSEVMISVNDILDSYNNANTVRKCQWFQLLKKCQCCWHCCGLLLTFIKEGNAKFQAWLVKSKIESEDHRLEPLLCHTLTRLPYHQLPTPLISLFWAKLPRMVPTRFVSRPYFPLPSSLQFSFDHSHHLQ